MLSLPGIRAVNRCLRVAVLLVALGFIVEPLFPWGQLFFQQYRDRTAGYRYQGILAQRAGVDPKELLPVPADVNRLVLPTIGVDALILEGTSAAVLDQGVWRRPHTSVPGRGGNTVLTAHRFLRTFGPNTFYFLDHLRPGDPVVVFWRGQEYGYSVESLQTVPADALWVESPTTATYLTLYTCTPLWSSKNRLVVRARPVPT